MPRLLFLVPDLGPSEPGELARQLAIALRREEFGLVIGDVRPPGPSRCREPSGTEATPDGGPPAHPGSLPPAVARSRSARGTYERPGGLVEVPFHLHFPLDPIGWGFRRHIVRQFVPDVIHAFGPAAAQVARLLLLPGIVPRKRPAVVASAVGPDDWLTRLALRSADRITTPTRADADRFARTGIPKDRLVVIPPTVPPAPPPPDPLAFRRSLNIPESARLIVAAGDFDAASGLRDAVWAFDVLKYVAGGLYLVLVGDGPERGRAEEFARSVGSDDYRVRFAGERADWPALFALAEIAWVTHRRGGLAQALAAMAAGKPVVAFGTPELAEIVEDGVIGRLAPVGDRVRLAGLTLELLEDPGQVVRLGGAGAARAAGQFSQREVAVRFAHVYHELARDPRP